MRSTLLQSLKNKPKRQLYSAAAMLIFTGSWIMRTGWNSWPMAALSSITILTGLAAFLLGLIKKEELDPNADGTEFIPSTRQIKLLVICSILFSTGHLSSEWGNDKMLEEIVSSIFTLAAFGLLIFAAPKKHKPPVIFLLLFFACFFIYLYFFER